MKSSRVGCAAIGLALLALAAGCSGDTAAPDDGGADETAEGSDADEDGADEAETVTCTPAGIECTGGAAYLCNASGDGWESVTPCAGATPLCIAGLGCAACRPGTAECADAGTARTCAADGSAWVTELCDPLLDETCVGEGLCTDLSPACFAVLDQRSNEACDFWATQTANSGLPADGLATNRFAFEIGNRQTVPAHVRVLGPSGVLGEATVPSGATGVIALPWNEALRMPIGSVLAAGAGYRIKSDVPVTVVQFNPLEYYGGAMASNAYSNDASLLLPRHVLTGNYMIVSRPTFMRRSGPPSGTDGYVGMPGFLAVVGVEDGTQVRITFTATTQASTSGSRVHAYAPGETGIFMLDRLDVLQILTVVPAACTVTSEVPSPTNPATTDGFCAMDPTFDLTGSVVAADKPVAVFGGHDCANVPYDRWACDHLEEQLPPLEAWGTRYVAARSQPIGAEESVWRVISREDGNTISFQPGASLPATLDRGESHEFQTSADFLIEGTAPFLAVRFLVGQGSVLDSIGDPSMSLAVPVPQYRTEYGFFAPEVFRDDAATGRRGESWLDVMAPTDASVMLDGAAVAGFAPIGTLGFDVARVRIAGGPHVITSPAAFGITVYGYGNYVSYAMPGGMNVDPINPLP